MGSDPDVLGADSAEKAFRPFSIPREKALTPIFQRGTMIRLGQSREKTSLGSRDDVAITSETIAIERNSRYFISASFATGRARCVCGAVVGAGAARAPRVLDRSARFGCRRPMTP